MLYYFDVCSVFSILSHLYSRAAYLAPVRGQTFKRVVATDVLRGRLGAEPSVTETGQQLRMSVRFPEGC